MKIGEAPEYLTEQLRYVGEAQPYRLRSANNFRLQLAGTSAVQKTLYYKWLNMCNKMKKLIEEWKQNQCF